jgi:mono/diheme cytochrome c family protein
MKNFRSIIPVVLISLILFSCKRDHNDPGYIYYPDMTYSRAYETYSESPVFETGKTMRTPAEGTIPRGYAPYPYLPKSFEDQVKAGKELMNPVEVSKDVIADGKRQYEIFCLSCHGSAGQGDGHLYTSKLFTAMPTSLVGSYVQDKPDGEIYHVITVGSLSGLMGPHGTQITPENRWKIIHYVRSLAN